MGEWVAVRGSGRETVTSGIQWKVKKAEESMIKGEAERFGRRL